MIWRSWAHQWRRQHTPSLQHRQTWHWWISVSEHFNIKYRAQINVKYRALLHVYHVTLVFCLHFQSPINVSRTWKSHFVRLYFLLLLRLAFSPLPLPSFRSALKASESVKWLRWDIEIIKQLLNVYRWY